MILSAYRSWVFLGVLVSSVVSPDLLSISLYPALGLGGGLHGLHHGPPRVPLPASVAVLSGAVAGPSTRGKISDPDPVLIQFFFFLMLSILEFFASIFTL